MKTATLPSLIGFSQNFVLFMHKFAEQEGVPKNTATTYFDFNIDEMMRTWLDLSGLGIRGAVIYSNKKDIIEVAVETYGREIPEGCIISSNGSVIQPVKKSYPEVEKNIANLYKIPPVSQRSDSHFAFKVFENFSKSYDYYDHGRTWKKKWFGGFVKIPTFEYFDTALAAIIHDCKQTMPNWNPEEDKVLFHYNFFQR